MAIQAHPATDRAARLASRQARAMGSRLRLTALDRQAGAAWNMVLDVFEAAERTLSRFDADSALSRLNMMSGGRPQPVPEMLASALAVADRAYRVTGGLFDPRIIGALEAAGEHAGVRLPPSPPTLGRQERWLHLHRRGHAASVAAPVDLGGIGKGLALRWAARLLRRAGIGRFLLEAGGDLVAGSGPSGDQPWLVALEQPGSSDPAAVISLRNGGLATSSLFIRSWLNADGVTGHHLIDPRSGRPANTGLVSGTILDSDPAWAEVWSKVTVIAGRALVARRRAWWIDRSGRLEMTSHAALFTAWRRR